MFHPSKGLHQAKITFILMELKTSLIIVHQAEDVRTRCILSFWCSMYLDMLHSQLH